MDYWPAFEEGYIGVRDGHGTKGDLNHGTPRQLSQCVEVYVQYLHVSICKIRLKLRRGKERMQRGDKQQPVGAKA